MTLREYLNVVFATGSVFKVMSTLEKVYYEANPDATVENISKTYTETAQELMELVGVSDLDTCEIMLKWTKDEDEQYVDVSLYDTSLNTEYSISFTDWCSLVDLEVRCVDQTMSLTDIVAHILWELTFHGYTRKDILTAREELMNTIDEAKQERDTGKMITLDEFKKQLESDS